MAISLSEQLESDIKAYLHKTFGTYFSSLDERFAADIKEDVINTSDFHHGFYNDDDISIAFQRVTLGTVKRALHDLEQHGYLKKASRHRPNGSSTSNLYTVK